MLWVIGFIVALFILGRLFGVKAVLAGCGLTALALIGLLIFGGYSVLRSMSGSEQEVATAPTTITPIDKITPDDVFGTKSSSPLAATVSPCRGGDIEFEPNGNTKCVPHADDAPAAGPAFSDTCSQMVALGTKQEWCEDTVQVRKNIGVDDEAGHQRANSAVCTDELRGRFIRAIWAERPVNADFAEFRAGTFMSLAELCFSFLSEKQRSAAAWRWRAADGVIASYAAEWSSNEGRSEPDQSDWSQAETLLTGSMSHARFLPPSDVSVVRQRLQVVNAKLGR
jgi:hypothetical protein